MKLEQAKESESKECIVKLRQLSPEEQRRAEAWYREKRLHDEASALGSVIRKGEAKGQKRIVAAMRKLGFPEEQIAAIVKRSKNISIEPSDKPE